MLAGFFGSWTLLNEVITLTDTRDLCDFESSLLESMAHASDLDSRNERHEPAILGMPSFPVQRIARPKHPRLAVRLHLLRQCAPAQG